MNSTARIYMAGVSFLKFPHSTFISIICYVLLNVMTVGLDRGVFL